MNRQWTIHSYCHCRSCRTSMKHKAMALAYRPLTAQSAPLSPTIYMRANAKWDRERERESDLPTATAVIQCPFSRTQKWIDRHGVNPDCMCAHCTRTGMSYVGQHQWIIKPNKKKWFNQNQLIFLKWDQNAEAFNSNAKALRIIQF